MKNSTTKTESEEDDDRDTCEDTIALAEDNINIDDLVSSLNYLQINL